MKRKSRALWKNRGATANADLDWKVKKWLPKEVTSNVRHK